MQLTISSLHLYPIKSLGSIPLNTAQLSETGMAYDRFWMLVDEKGVFITQRDIPKLALFKMQLSDKGIVVNNALEIPYELAEKGEEITTKVFQDEVAGIKESERVNNWFSEQLGQKVSLIRSSKQNPRFVSNHPDTKVNFSDSNQYLLLGHASMNNLNTKLAEALPINRFRANIIFEGGTAHAEDTWRRIQIGTSIFEYTKLCGRCKVTTINQSTAEMGNEPLRTLATYRNKGKKICFGSYWKLTSSSDNQISVGDEIVILVHQPINNY